MGADDVKTIDKIIALLSSVYRSRQTDRPWITLTWAQSIDGKLSTSSTEQTIISGPASMQLTHGLRALHQTILVGINTVLVDNPRLTTRLSSTTESTLQPHFPIFGQSSSSPNDPVPIILDSTLRVPSTAKCLQPSRKSPMKPFIFCVSERSNLTTSSSLTSLAHVVPISSKEQQVDQNNANRQRFVSLPLVVEQLSSHRIDSVMVEGGTSVLSNFFAEGLWDVAIVTIAPAVFGDGPSLKPPLQSPNCFANLRFADSHWFQLGDDIVLVGFPDRSST